MRSSLTSVVVGLSLAGGTSPYPSLLASNGMQQPCPLRHSLPAIRFFESKPLKRMSLSDFAPARPPVPSPSGSCRRPCPSGAVVPFFPAAPVWPGKPRPASLPQPQKRKEPGGNPARRRGRSCRDGWVRGTPCSLGGWEKEVEILHDLDGSGRANSAGGTSPFACYRRPLLFAMCVPTG